MLHPTGSAARARRPLRRTVGAALAAALLLLLTGCADDPGEWERGGLVEGITDQTDRITALWQGAWTAALIVGFLVWGLIFYAAVVFRRRRGETGLPPQVRYNVPVEVLYTTLPIIVVLVFFFFTARDQDAIIDDPINDDRPAEAIIDVVGKRWSWDFNYRDAEGNPIAYSTGTPDEPPVLYLPVGQNVHFNLVTRDVMHAFWVPNFLFKLDLIPGRVNEFEVIPQREGDFIGRCAELCGENHARMLFEVVVLDPAEYEDRLQQLADAGQEGALPEGLGPDLSVGGAYEQSRIAGQGGSDR